MHVTKSTSLHEACVDAANSIFVEALHVVNKRPQKLVCLANDVAGQNYLVTVTWWEKKKKKKKHKPPTYRSRYP
jgi:hypothetical protein